MQSSAGLHALRLVELALWGMLAVAALIYLLRAPLWSGSTAGARLGGGDAMLAIGAPSFECAGAAATIQCETNLGDDALRITFTPLPTLTCVASYGGSDVECVASYVYAPRLKPMAILPQLRRAAPPLWSWSGALVRVDSVLAFRMGLFVWSVSLLAALLVGLRVARRSHGSKLRRYALAALLSAFTWVLAMGALLLTVFVLGYDD
jgi:hypothetical protein